MKRYGYTTTSDLQNDLNKLNKKIDGINLQDNIINHSSIEEIEDDIKVIDEKIKITERNNKLKFCIKNIKIFGRALQGIFPYVVMAGLVFGTQTLIFDVPFVRQDQFKIAQHEQIIDNTGILDDTITYVVSSSQPSNSAYYSTKWEKKDDGRYYRTIKKYYIKNQTIDELKEIVNNPDIKFDDVFEKSSSVEYQVKTEDEITEKDLQEGTSYKIVYRYKDDEDVVLEIQDVGQNVGFSVLYVFFAILSYLPVMVWRDTESNYDFKKHVRRIKIENQEVDLDQAMDILRKTKIKFERVKNQYITIDDPIMKGKVKML